MGTATLLNADKIGVNTTKPAPAHPQLHLTSELLRKEETRTTIHALSRLSTASGDR